MKGVALLRIRGAVETDTETIAVLSGQLGYPAPTSEVQERLQRILTQGDGLVFVAEIGGRVVGWVHVHGKHDLESPARAEIGGIVVDERHRRRGIGEELMAAAEDWARSMRYATLRLRSNVIREDAHRFYRRLGYSETKRQVVLSKVVTESDITDP